MKRFTSILLSVCLVLCLTPNPVWAQAENGSLPDLYDAAFTPAGVSVLSPSQAQSTDTDVALVRLDNQKIAFMTRGADGNMAPFYPVAMETGFWDTRQQGQTTDWDAVFEKMRQMGINTVQPMIHWSDWNPSDGVYDYAFLDTLVTKAASHGLKVYFAIFFHYQWNMDTKYDNFYAYHLDDREGKCYSIQWGTGNLNNPGSIRAAGLEVFPEYWHPEVYPRLIAALENLAAHYRDSDTVIAYQLGNEEGFNYYLNNGNDTNPYYDELFAKWKTDTGKTSEQDFRRETILGLWQRMANAIHSRDPYKTTTTNFQASLPEKIGGFNWNEGVDVSFYKDAGLDMVGPMFYGNDCYKIWNNLDPVYNYTTQVPILFPTEIGAKGTQSIALKTYALNSLERGAQGFGIYCYGEMLNTEHEGNIIKLASMINANADIIHAGLPISSQNAASNIFLSSGNAQARLRNLEKNANAALGLLYFNDTVRNNPATQQFTIPVTLTARNAGNYQITALVDGNADYTQSVQLPAGDSHSFELSMTNYQNAFIRVTSDAEATPTPQNVALGKPVTSDSEQAGHAASLANDGNAGTRWCAENKNAGHWLSIDLGETLALTGADIAWEKNNAYQYKIEVSANGTDWEVACDKTGNALSSQSTSDAFSASGRYVRLTVTGGLSSTAWASLFELKIYGSAQTPQPAQNTCRIKSVLSGKYLDIGGTDAGARIVQKAASGAATQIWEIEPRADGYCTIKNTATDTVVDVFGSQTQDGAPLIHWQAYGTNNQLWQIEQSGGEVKIKGKMSGKYIGVDGDGEGAALSIYTSSEANSQKFVIEPV